MISAFKIGISSFLFCGLMNAAIASGSHSEYSKSSEDKYDLGKKIFYDQVVCDSCPYAHLEFTSENISMLLSDLKYDQNLGKKFGVIDRTSIQYFLKKRFTL